MNVNGIMALSVLMPASEIIIIFAINILVAYLII